MSSIFLPELVLIRLHHDSSTPGAQTWFTSFFGPFATLIGFKNMISTRDVAARRAPYLGGYVQSHGRDNWMFEWDGVWRGTLSGLKFFVSETHRADIMALSSLAIAGVPVFFLLVSAAVKKLKLGQFIPS